MDGAKIVVSRAPAGAPAGKLADAVIVFTSGLLAGLKLVGFTIWDGRDGANRGVTFPARQYTINGERRFYVLLRADGDSYDGAENLRARILKAYEEQIGG